MLRRSDGTNSLNKADCSQGAVRDIVISLLGLFDIFSGVAAAFLLVIANVLVHRGAYPQVAMSPLFRLAKTEQQPSAFA